MTKLLAILTQISLAMCLLPGCHTAKETQAANNYNLEKVQELARVVSPSDKGYNSNVQITPRTYSHTERIAIRLDSLMNDPLLETTQMGFYVYDLTDNRPIYDKGKRQRMRPASTMKIVTAVTALAQLGENYHYTTPLYTTGYVKGNKLTGDLYVRGSFDPLIDHKAINAFVNALYKEGIRRIQGHLFIDLSMKDDMEAGWGWCWDDKNPSLSPLLFNGKDTFGTTFIKALQTKGIAISNKIKTGRVPSSAKMLCAHQTAISEILEPMMKESVNQDAESLFYQIAAQAHKPYVDCQDASKYIKQFINEALQLNANDYFIADGSGLSLYDYVTPELLVAFLKYAYQNKNIYQPLLLSLPVAGIDGTLKRRLHNTAAYNNIYAKTGTVTGICSLAGYATASNGHQLCFAIINQGQKRSAEARTFQDKVCCILTE